MRAAVRAKTLGRQARELTPPERIALVEDLLDSLDRVDPRIDSLWVKEANERLAAYRRGELAAKDLNEIVAKYRP
jgi:putative addiction module component (TIGR02574 family)